METSATSFLQLLWDISVATRSRKKSETDYVNLLRRIFEKEEDLHDTTLTGRRKEWITNYDSQRKIFEKGGRPGTEHADPEVQHKDDVAEEVFGRERELEKLWLKCCQPDAKGLQLSVIPILGAGGIGKTTLARHFYEHKLVQKHFEMRVWVKLNGQEFRLHHAAQEILKSAMGMLCSIDDLDELDEMVRDTLQWRRCLIVFDGVESMTEDLWIHMNKYWFDLVDLGSKVVITTPSEGVANLVANEPFELKQLHPYHGLSLYEYKADVPSDIVKIMSRQVYKNIIALCEYIPLLLKLVGSMMRYDEKLRNLLSSVPVSDEISLSTSDASVAILLCVWALPLHLRQCLAYCAIFPKGYALDREKIINMWVAQGLVKPSPEINLHDIGDSYFHQLLCRSFFTDIARNEYGDITEFWIPGLIHKIMQDVASTVWNGKLGVIGSISEDADQLSLHSEFAGKHFPEGPEDVRTLILSPTLYSGGSSLDHALLDFQELQSLDLSCSGIRNLSDNMCALRKLRYLNLSYTLIEKLPDSITALSRLQTLDLSWCYHFKVLPKGMRNMKFMIHLDFSHCESLSYMPSGIGHLISLTSMPLFVLGEDRDCARLGELRLLNLLRGRLDIKNLENVMEISDARKAKLNQKNLHHLGLCWSKNVDDCFEVLELLRPNQQLKVLDLTGYMGSRFPRWISSIRNLIKISITNCGCKKLPSLGQLPLLKELQLKGMTNIVYIGSEFYGKWATDAFPSLEQLGLYDIPRLLKWSGAGLDMGFGIFALPMFRSLKTLTIEGCPQLQDIPNFRNLIDLIVSNSNDRIFSSVTRVRSLSSLFIKNMELGTTLLVWKWRHSLKKLILFNITDHFSSPCLDLRKFPSLKHLGIEQCPQVTSVVFFGTISIQKLHVADCKNLMVIIFGQEATKLTELVVDGCPRLYFPESNNLRSLTKLMIKNSYIFSGIHMGNLENLQYLSISECPLLELELERDPSLISHIPRVVLGNRKASEHDLRQKSGFKGSSTIIDRQQDSDNPVFWITDD